MNGYEIVFRRPGGNETVFRPDWIENISDKGERIIKILITISVAARQGLSEIKYLPDMSAISNCIRQLEEVLKERGYDNEFTGKTMELGGNTEGDSGAGEREVFPRASYCRTEGRYQRASKDRLRS